MAGRASILPFGRRPLGARWLGGFAVLRIVLSAGPVLAVQTPLPGGGELQLHGFVETQLRALSEGFRADRWFVSQWSNRLDLEFEFDIAEDGWGPFDSISGFARVEARIECVYKSMCGLAPSYGLFGGSARRAPRNFTDGTTSGFSGKLRSSEGRERIHRDDELVSVREVSPFRELFALGSTNLDTLLAPVSAARFAVRSIDRDNARGPGVLPQGPWRPGFDIQSVGALRSVPSTTNPADPDLSDADRRGGLLLRPAQDSIFTPSAALRSRSGRFDAFDQNLSENDLFFNHGAGQDEGELKELYFDLELFDSRLWLRLGKQTIVWGKTELFSATDQFNPQDLAVSSLAGLEESRIALWAARGVWSFYDVGPLEDVRLELAANLDDFEPLDLGFCGEPYTPFPVCAKSFGLFGHGLAGIGIAGEERPPSFWRDAEGLEFGARLEFRWERFSFAIADFYGFSDSPHLFTFNSYERSVDPATGRPLDTLGQPFDTSGIGDPLVDDRDLPGTAAGQAQAGARERLRDQARQLHPGNRQLFDLVCGATVGIASAVIPNPALELACIPDLLNNSADLGLVPFVAFSAADAFSVVLAGNGLGEFIAGALVGGASVPLVELNRDPGDGVVAPGLGPPNCAGLPFPGTPCLSTYLSDSQEALLGCGPFYGTHCDKHGVDLFNAEFSVLGQRLPNVEAEAPVATRVLFEGGRRRVVVLPGARGPDQPGYDPRIDGCIDATSHPLCVGATQDLRAQGFGSEMEALSFNFVRLLGALGAVSPEEDDPLCGPDRPERCKFVRAVAALSGVQRPSVSAERDARFGRRDFIWHGGGEAVLRYNKRNVLGFSLDFAEDRSKTNWSLEATWVAREAFVSSRARNGVHQSDVFNLTVSVDRPTFIRFLNPSRTFFMNSQWFIRWIEDTGGSRTLAENGPVSVLATFAIATGYFQDRLLPSLVFVHDFSSASGGQIVSFSYRYNQDFSVTLGMAHFYGKPRRHRTADYPLTIENSAPPYLARTNYQGLSAIAERDELFLKLRYTF